MPGHAEHLLAPAHPRVGDAARIAGYCGNSTVLDMALAEWAESYGDQTEQDHATLVDFIKRGKTKAMLNRRIKANERHPNVNDM